MSVVKSEVELRSDSRTVWDTVTDPARFGDFVAGWAGGGPTTERDRGVGAEYRWTAALGPLELGCTERVVRWNDGERVEYEGEMAGVPFRSAMEVAPTGDDRSRLRVEIDYDVPTRLGGRVAGRLLEPVVRTDVDRSLERLEGLFGHAEDTPGVLNRSDVVRLYRKRAKRYDVATQLYRLVGFPLDRARRETADALALSPGDTVVEIGCGTGANFPYLQERVGPTGRIVGVDLTDSMLAQARARVDREGWDNVELVHGDAADFEFPEGVNGIVSTLAITLSPDYDTIIERGARALAPGGRWVILDLTEPPGLPEWAVQLGLALTKAYGVTREAATRDSATSLRTHLPHTWVRSFYFGLAYIAVGEKR